MTHFAGKNIVITGGTDGIGAATALGLVKQGAQVTIVGRDRQKASALAARAKVLQGRLSYLTSDFSLMSNVRQTALEIANSGKEVDFLVHCVGTLITRKQFTSEGFEKDFAVSFLSRFVFNETLAHKRVMTSHTKIVNLAASSPRIPSFARMEFDSITEVRSRTGMVSHGQAQLANDLYTVLAADRYHLVAIGYGPGSVDTNIRREIPKVIRMLMKPFFYWTTRQPEHVAADLLNIMASDRHFPGHYYFYNKSGAFAPSEFITNKKRQQDLLNTTLQLLNPLNT